jgi:hypothetical protein
VSGTGWTTAARRNSIASAQRNDSMDLHDVAWVIREHTDAGIVAGFRHGVGSASVRLLLKFKGPD